MSTTPLSNLQELVERSLFESIRKEVVDKGYLPDITAQVEITPVTIPPTYTNKYPNTLQGRQQWELDIKNIVNSKGFAIEIYNEGSNLGKGIKKVPRIVINSGNSLPGALGGDPSRFYEDTGNSYLPMVTPPQTVDLFIDIHVVSDNVIQERILNAIMALALPRRGYIKHYNDPTKTFFIRFINFYDRDDLEGGIVEKVYGYEIPDCWDRADIQVGPAVSKITQITVPVTLQKYMDGTWNNPEVSSELKVP